MTPAGAVVVGVGNEFRQDDGIGPATVAALRARALPGVRLIDSDGEPTGLLDAWSDAELAIIVDAVRYLPAVPGRLHRIVPLPPSSSSRTRASTHGLGVADALALAEVLGRAPRLLVLYAVEVKRTGHGPDLSPAVRAALPRVVRAVLTELATTSRGWSMPRLSTREASVR